jgi:alpha-tubulin suppressor-like RCC1 family protein
MSSLLEIIQSNSKHKLIKQLNNSNNENEIIKILEKINNEIILNGITNINKKDLIESTKIKNKELKEINKFNNVWTSEVKKKYSVILKNLKRIDTIDKKIKTIKDCSSNKNILQILGRFSGVNSSKVYKIIPDGLFSGLKVSKIACGGNHILFLTQYNDVFSFGITNTFGQLGLGNYDSVCEPTSISSLPECIDISCGYAYSAAISKDNILYTWGAGENGRLGTGSTKDENTPRKISTNFKVKKVECGSTHTCILSNSNRIYSFGHELYNGQKKKILKPKIINELKNISFLDISIGPGGYHTLALTLFGHVYTWGHNRVGQLGFENKLTKDYDSDSDCEDDKEYIIKKPRLINSLKDYIIIQISAGWGCSAVLESNYKVLICGRNYRGQVSKNPKICPKNDKGHPYTHIFSLVKELDNIKKISLGGEHSAALTFNNELYSWGDDCEGQLGHDILPTDYYKSKEKFTIKPYKFEYKNNNINNINLYTNCTFLLIKF